VPQPAAVQVPALSGQRQQGGVHQQLLVEVAAGVGRRLHVVALSGADDLPLAEGDVPHVWPEPEHGLRDDFTG
jgi:hypothetical protein